MKRLILNSRSRRLVLCLGSVLAALFSVGWASVCSATPITYFEGIDESNLDLTNSNLARANFVATLASFAEETMEGVGGQVDPVLFVGTEFEATTDFDQVFSFLPLSVSPTHALLDDGPPSAEGLSFNDWIQFQQPITAFGSYFIQAGDGPANTLTLRLENTGLGTSKDVVMGTFGPGAPFFNIFFFGVTDTDPFDRVTMIETFDFDGILLDNVVAGHVAVPEPGTIASLGCGAIMTLLAGGVRRRLGRRRSVNKTGQ